jgi:hypothetical protein
MVYALDVVYCARCRIGTVDEQGLCRLCGAPQRPPTRLGRLAEAGGLALNAMLQPGVLVVLAVAGALLLAAVVAMSGSAPPAGVPRVGPGALFGPPASLTAVQHDPVGAVLRFLVPVLVQALLFGFLLLSVFLLLRRRRPAPPPRERPGSG